VTECEAVQAARRGVNRWFNAGGGGGVLNQG
jgi:hypothetical protein